MSKGAQTFLYKTKNIPCPNEYIKSLYNECKGIAFDEEDCLKFKGSWVEKIFHKNKNVLLHLEIGTGNGSHFYQIAKENPKNYFLGIELKYKPLIQGARRIKKDSLQNAKLIRYNAKMISDLFGDRELDNIYIYFPDPWKKQKQSKHKLISKNFSDSIFKIQKKRSLLKFKTDSKKYFFDSIKIFEKTGYKIESLDEDLYGSKNNHENINFNKLTQFELIFVKKNTPIYFSILRK